MAARSGNRGRLDAADSREMHVVPTHLATLRARMATISASFDVKSSELAAPNEAQSGDASDKSTAKMARSIAD
jgi:hypothetical protein